jgi:predicted GH43/DUF377 family glycosyl hydrolase
MPQRVGGSIHQLIGVSNRIMVLSTQLEMTRLNGGRPIISANPDSWDSRFTFNPTATYLERSPANDPIIQGLLSDYSLEDPILAHGVVAIYYRGIPKERPGLPTLRSSIGLAIFTPDLRQLKRLPYPVIAPTDDPMAYDYNGVEDQRITRIGDTFYLVYCGFVKYAGGGWKVQVCMAESHDLLHWRKLGPVKGT